jgi:SsrA-binding protein
MSITENRKAFHDYFVEDRYEAGLVLEGWEVKAIRRARESSSCTPRRSGA